MPFVGWGDDPALKMEPRKAAAKALALTGSIQARLPLTLCPGLPGKRTAGRPCRSA